MAGADRRPSGTDDELCAENTLRELARGLRGSEPTAWALHGERFAFSGTVREIIAQAADLQAGGVVAHGLQPFCVAALVEVLRTSKSRKSIVSQHILVTRLLKATYGQGRESGHPWCRP